MRFCKSFDISDSDQIVIMRSHDSDKKPIIAVYAEPKKLKGKMLGVAMFHIPFGSVADRDKFFDNFTAEKGLLLLENIDKSIKGISNTIALN